MYHEYHAYNKLKILVTGHTGFKGSWLCSWLHMLGAEVTGYALSAPTPSLFNLLQLDQTMQSYEGDINDADTLNTVVLRTKPDVIFHMAAQSLVLPSFQDPIYTFATNVMGTVTLLESVRKLDNHCVVINVTTDKCYANDDSGEAFKETSPLGGNSPYAASKAASELVSHCYNASYFTENSNIALASARAGNVIGGGDFAEHRIITDIIRALEQNQPITLRNPHAIRPWQHVLDVLNGYLLLGEKMLATHETVGNFNFAPNYRPVEVKDLVIDILTALDKPTFPINIEESSTSKEDKVLLLDAQKAHDELGWSPKLSLAEMIALTASWYKTYLTSPEDIKNYSETMLKDYASK